MRNLLKTNRATAKQLNPFASLQHEVNSVIDDFYDLFETNQSNLKSFDDLRITPALDIVEDENCYKVEAELPGMGEEDIHVALDGNVLIISGEKETSKKDEQKNYISREISYGRYERSITLPENADLDKADASFKKGMLWVEIPKKSTAEGKARKLDVKKAK